MSTAHVEAPLEPSARIDWWRRLRRGCLLLITCVAIEHLVLPIPVALGTYLSLRFGPHRATARS